MSQAIFVQQGDVVDFTSDVDLPAGSVVVQGELLGITKHDIKANRLGALCVEGVFDVEKDPTASMSAGARIYWDATNNHAVTVATGNKLMGKSILAAGVDTTVVRLRLSQ